MPQLCNFKELDKGIKESNKYVNEIISFRHRFKHKLGQNFIKNERVLYNIVNVFSFSNEDVVLEIGPGMGFLTEKLLNKGISKLILVEYDKDLCEYLEIKFKEEIEKGIVVLIKGDFLKVKDSLEEYEITKCVSNLPYQISSKVVEWLAVNKIDSVLMLQKEFVYRIMANEKDKDYSRLSVLCSLFFYRKKIMDVDRKNFYPKPKVDSSVVKLTRKNIDMSEKEIKEFLYFVKAVFVHKNKKIGKSFYKSRVFYRMDKEEVKNILDKMPYKDEKVKDLGVKELIEVFRYIKNYSSSS